MIKYSLICANDHAFEGWFSCSSDYDAQCENDLLSCPVCDSMSIRKTLMAPSVTKNTNGRNDPENVSSPASGVSSPSNYTQAMSQLREMRSQVLANAENVGENFPEEARKIHYGETQKRGIYGQANTKDVEGLVDEGIYIVPIPELPEDKN